MKQEIKTKSNIKAVIFDVGGVLALGRKTLFLKNHSSKGVHEYMAKKLRISLDAWFDSIDTIYAKAIEGKASKEKALEIMSKNNNTTHKKLEGLFAKAYRKNFKQNKRLYKLAFKLKEKGYKIAILSDQWPVSKEALMPKKYTERFDAVVVSCDVGLRKPNIKIYKLLFKKLKMHYKNSVFIDNRDWNLKPAKKLGIKIILFESNRQLFKDLRKRGVEI